MVGKLLTDHSCRHGGAVSRWLGSVEGLSEIAQRLLRVQIEHAPAIEVIARYDSPETLFYGDPPYPHDSRGDTLAYAYEMTDDKHRALAQALHNVRGKVAVSGYHCHLMNELYGDWQQIEAPPKNCMTAKRLRTEVLWVNYEGAGVAQWQRTRQSVFHHLPHEPLAVASRPQ